MATKPPKLEKKKTVATLTHEEASRKNIPTAEFQSVMRKDEQSPIRVAYERRNRDLDPQLVWRGKDEQDWSDLVTHAPPIYIQEKVHPKVLIDDLLRRSAADRKVTEDQIDLFADFNGVPEGNAKTEFYQHDANWSNRMILGDSLQVMASLAEREGLRGQVQCVYIDPPYGIKFNSNFQWSTTSRTVTDGNAEQITREPEQVKAFRDTWRDGIHSYLSYLRDRLTVARDLLTDSGSIFVQIGDENVHRVRALMDEVLGDANLIAEVAFKTTSSFTSNTLSRSYDFILWYGRNAQAVKYRPLYQSKTLADDKGGRFTRIQEANLNRRFMTAEERGDEETVPSDARIYRHDNPYSQGRAAHPQPFSFQGYDFDPWLKNSHWKCQYPTGVFRLARGNRMALPTAKSISYVRFLDDFGVQSMANVWLDTQTGAFTDDKIYVVQTNTKVIERCILMATDPGDLVVDPTCGSGTTAYIAEQWGRRWITVDTSRVALALARARIMGARYPYYFLADSKDGQQKVSEVTHSVPSEIPIHGDIRQGFVYERVTHITLKSIANNAEIDVIWDKFQGVLEPLREQLNAALKQKWEEWEIPWDADDEWSNNAKTLHGKWWQQRIARQTEIDASIAANAESEYLYDRPYDDRRKVRVAGPFTVESLSPHRVLAVDENDELIDGATKSKNGDEQGFVDMILENLKTAGVQQAHKEDKITFSSITPWPGDMVCAEGRYAEGAGKEKRAAIFIGPEFGTVSRPDLVEAAREAGDAGFDVLVACAFNYDARSTDFEKLGRIPVLKARMNADLHMADDLKNTGKGNLFVIFGEPDIDILNASNGQIKVKVNGVDVFHPNTGEVRSDGAEGIACWFIDTDYNEESFFVRHAYFLGANDPYKALKTTLKAEVNEDAWATLNSDTSRPFDKPKSGRIAVKVINHLGDEAMKVFRVA
ncbi:MAG: site-specific DNA-methyltransferase [Bryobacteraceae bacterium]|jgi:adenine-specific DNA-methyltransferase